MLGSKRTANVAQLLLSRESGGVPLCAVEGARHGTRQRLERWGEDDSLAHCSASYCTFHPAPRSTIALSYNCTGTLLASTQ